MSDRTVLYRALVAALAALVLGEALLLAAVDGPLLVTLSRGAASPAAPAASTPLSLVQSVEGLTRLDGAPELLLGREQAERLVPVMPLLREALAAGEPASGSPTVEHFGAMLLAYLQRTLTPEQKAHLQALAARGELVSTASEVLDRLPQLDKALRQRAGLPLQEGLAVRRSLDVLRVRDLLLGMLLLEEQEEVRLTPAQAELLAPMQTLLQGALKLRPGEVGKITLPLLEAQVRSLLTERQQKALVRTSDEKGLESVEVNVDELLQQFGSLVAARRKGGTFRFDLASIVEMHAADGPRDGPAVIPQRADLELPVLVRGIMLQLEGQPSLRLTDEQVDELGLVGPRVQQCLVNLMNRVMDDGIPEVEGRVASLLTAEQIHYLREHQHDQIPMLEYSSGEEPVAKELGRFLAARSAGQAYRPRFHQAPGARPAPPPGAMAQASPAPAQSPRPAPADSPPPPPAPAAPPTPAAPDSPQARPSPIQAPLEAIVRGILFGLEKDPDLRLRRSQLERLEGLAPRLRAALNEIEAGRRNDDSRLLERELQEFLSGTQLAVVHRVAAEPPMPLHASSGESPLAREVGRFLEARLARREYDPLRNPEAP